MCYIIHVTTFIHYTYTLHYALTHYRLRRVYADYNCSMCAVSLHAADYCIGQLTCLFRYLTTYRARKILSTATPLLFQEALTQPGNYHTRSSMRVTKLSRCQNDTKNAPRQTRTADPRVSRNVSQWKAYKHDAITNYASGAMLATCKVLYITNQYTLLSKCFRYCVTLEHMYYKQIRFGCVEWRLCSK